MKVSRPTWFPKDSAGGGVTNRIEERGHPPLHSAGGGYIATLSPKDGREQASKGRLAGLTSAQNASGEHQGADQAPLAAIARVSAAKSETWILVLCLRMYSMKGVLTRGTNEETGSQVSWDGP